MSEYFLVKRAHGSCPVGDGDGAYAALVMDVASEAEVRERLAGDPWGEDMLATESVERWSIFLSRAHG
jgi:hypothetical protein